MFPWYFYFSGRDLWSFPFYCFLLFLCIGHRGRFSYFSFLFFETMHSDGHIFPFLLCFSLLFFSQLFVRPPQTDILLFYFLFLGMVLLPAFCTMSRTSIHSSSGTLPIRSSPLNLFLTSTVSSLGIWFRSYLNGVVVFPTLFNISLNLAIRSSWSELQSAPGLVFADCIELLHLWLHSALYTSFLYRDKFRNCTRQEAR